MGKFVGRAGGRIWTCLAGLVVAPLIGGMAIADTSSVFTYSAAKSGYYSISPLAFSPSDDGATPDYDINGSSISSDTAGTACFSTGVFLPQGATLVALDLHYRSNNQSQLLVKLARERVTTSQLVAFVDRALDDNSDTFKAAALPVPAVYRTINNVAYTYGLQICLGVGTRFYNARIRYTYKSAGD